MLIILLLNPFNINSLSLQLSFGGTLGIILFLEFLYKRNENKIIGLYKECNICFCISTNNYFSNYA